MKRFFLIFLLWLSGHAWAEISFFKLDQDPIRLAELSEPIVKSLNAAPDRRARYSLGLGLMIDNVKYYVKPSSFMTKSRPDEVCTPTGESLTYQCIEGQRFAAGCHLLFFNAKKEWVGVYTININPKIPPSYCSDVAGMGVADKAKNEMLVTSQYFLLNGGGARKVSELGSNFIRMTSLLKIKAINGKIEVEQDDACLGNPNLIDNIPDARTALNICQKKLSCPNLS